MGITTEPGSGRFAAVDPRLWMLISPALPVGGYSYSQGLEHAVQAGWVTGYGDARHWISGIARRTLPRVDLPCLAHIARALEAGERTCAAQWNRQLLACRETSELRAEDAAMGEALLRLLRGLDLQDESLTPPGPVSFAAAFALACRVFSITVETACAAYAWVWCENQVAAAVKLVPLGQTEGQRILLDLAGELELLVDGALARDTHDIGMTLPGLAIASAAHESQYSRLFRS